MWIGFSMTLAACSLCLLCWWAGSPYARKANASSNGTQPWTLRLLWPWVDALAPVILPLLSWHVRTRLQRLFQQAGVLDSWTPQHFCAWQCVLAILGAGLTALCLYGVLSATVTIFACALVAALAAGAPRRQLRERVRRRKAAMLRELPFILDMITLCVEGGLNLHGALQQAALHAPAGPMRDELRHMLADLRAGAMRREALEQWAIRCDLPVMHHFVAAVAQAEQSGMNLGPVLRSQADQRRAERFLRAEKAALEAPVKMMFPLVFCIFPCSFLIIAFPIGVQFLALFE